MIETEEFEPIERSLKINTFLISATILLAPIVAWFYHEDRLTGMIVALAFGAFSLCLASAT
ncbi:hypothetical protein [Stanieria cyanosphaera]|uniref:hypothetical protein n=1 Tax=Stanieria cyanosphaera TaxID=102116 RepID=UPI0002D700AA|nr:hypothetical protein [Stanieria cyanosphaera]